ncbi:MAG: hypothetical protein ACRDZX_03540 [Acidimicrobiales bacterium]
MPSRSSHDHAMELRQGAPEEARPAPSLSQRACRATALSFALLSMGAFLPAQAALAAPAGHPATRGQADAVTNVSASYNFTTLDDHADATFNQLLGVNDFGVIAGYFGSGSPAATHPNKGYRVEPYSGATFVSENYPGSQQTQVTAINDWGNTVGFYATPGGANYGFLDESGVMSKVADPMTSSNPPVNQLLGLNNEGQAVGFYNDAKGNSHAYIWDRHSKEFTPVTPPGATSATATAINDHGAVAGFFTQADGDTAGFIGQRGHWKVVQFPGSKNTQIFGLNDQGKAVGTYAAAHNQTHGFIYSNGASTTLDDPNGVGSTVVNGLNNIGTVVGFYTDAKGDTDGFVASAHVVGIPTP